MELKDNLERIRKERKFSQAKLARAAGVSQQLISRLENALDLTTKKLPDIARALGVPPDQIDENYAPDVPDNGWIAITARLLNWVSAGKIEAPDDIPPSDPTDPPATRTAAGPDLDPEGNWIALRVKGDSMDRISPPDSTIFVNLKDRRLVPNACYVIQDAEGGSSYKRYRPGKWEAVSTNKKHRPYLIKGDRGPLVIGRVRLTVLDL